MATNRHRRRREDKEGFEWAKRQVLHDIEFNEFLASLSAEGRKRARKEAEDLVEAGKSKVAQGVYLQAIRLFREAYNLDRREGVREVLVETYRIYGLSLLNVGDWARVILTLDPLKGEGLATGAIYYVLALANNTAFEMEGSIFPKYLRKALEEIGGAMGDEPLNPLYHVELAKTNAYFARWWKGTKDESRYLPRYRDKAIEGMTTAHTLQRV